MVYEKGIKGCYVDLKSAKVSDAEFTLSIRQDKDFSRYLPRINNTLEQQREWIRSQRKKTGDYFFVVWDKTEKQIGTISIYVMEGDFAEGGRLAIRGNALQNIEAQLLLFRFGYDILGLKQIVGYVYAENTRALRFAESFGTIIDPPKERNGRLECKITNTKENFVVYDKKLSALIYRQEHRKKK